MSRPISLADMVTQFKENHYGSHLFKIDNFSHLWTYGIRDVESSVFDLGGLKWKLVLYPDGDETDNWKGHVSLYLESQNPESLPFNWLGTFNVKLFMANQFRRVWRNGRVAMDASGSKCGAARLIPHTIFREKGQGFLVDDCAMVGVKFLSLEDPKLGTAECFTLIEKPPNNKVTWKMTKFSSFLRNTDNMSHEFVIGSRKWKIQLYPRGYGEGEGNSLSLYLSGEGYTDNALKTKTYAKFKLRVLDQINRKHMEGTVSYWFPAEPKSWGFSKMMSLEDLRDPSKGYLVNDLLYVGVQMDVVSTTKPC